MNEFPQTIFVISYAFTLYVLPKFAENNPSFYLFKEVKPFEHFYQLLRLR